MQYRFVYEAVFEPDEGGYAIYFPDLPGALSQGSDLTEASLNAAEALEVHIGGFLLDGEDLPASTFGHELPEGALRAIVVASLTDEEVKARSYLTIGEAAEALGVTPGRVSQLITRGLLQAIGEGTGRRVSPESVQYRLDNPKPAGRPKA